MFKQNFWNTHCKLLTEINCQWDGLLSDASSPCDGIGWKMITANSIICSGKPIRWLTTGQNPLLSYTLLFGKPVESLFISTRNNATRWHCDTFLLVWNMTKPHEPRHITIWIHIKALSGSHNHILPKFMQRLWIISCLGYILTVQ